MSIHRFMVLIAVAGVTALLGTARLQAQAPPGFGVPTQMQAAGEGDDAAARALRYLVASRGRAGSGMRDLGGAARRYL